MRAMTAYLKCKGIGNLYRPSNFEEKATDWFAGGLPENENKIALGTEQKIPIKLHCWS
jgi:hypothetical protein